MSVTVSCSPPGSFLPWSDGERFPRYFHIGGKESSAFGCLEHHHSRGQVKENTAALSTPERKFFHFQLILMEL